MDIALHAVKIMVPATLAFFIGFLIERPLSKILYKNKLWKKKNVQKTIDGKEATISAKLHNDEKSPVPRMGGVLVWGTACVVVFILFILQTIYPSQTLDKLNFLSRNQTWLPLFTLILTALVGLADDYLVVKDRGGYNGGGLSLTKRIALVSIIGLSGGLWFYQKLGVDSMSIPFYGDLYLGWFLVPIFVIVMVAMYSGGVIDGIDGLSGGVFASIWTALSIIAFSNSQIDLAAFCAVIIGGLLVFLWFNVPPAKFYMSETGTMALTTTASVVAFLTDSVFLLPLIALPLVVTVLSTIIQLLSKKFRNGKKVFLVAPLHHHFEVKGWLSSRVVMRYWIVSIICAIIGVIIYLAGRGF